MNTFGKIEFKVSDPIVSFCETVIKMFSVKRFAHTPNQSNKLTMICEPIEKSFCEEIEKGYINMDQWNLIKKFNLFEKYSWDIL
jgi:U5 small nuclear ribonucleoprotein component